MKATTKKIKLEGFITTQEHIRLLKKKRPEIYSSLKHPSLRACVAWNTMDHRTQLGFTQAQLAAKSGVSCRAVQYLEDITAKFSPTLDVIEKVSKVLKVEVVDLIKRVDLTKAV